MVDSLGGNNPSPTDHPRTRTRTTERTTPLSSMSSDESPPQSLRKISDETLSQRLNSDAQTAMTSVLSTDDNRGTDEDGLEDQPVEDYISIDAEHAELYEHKEDSDGGEYETVSIYPNTFYERRSSNRDSTPRADNSSGHDLCVTFDSPNP